VTASTHALLYVILSPSGPYFSKASLEKGVALLAVHEHVRSWPGGTGGFKLGLNYAPCFAPQRTAAARGYDQVLWLLGDDRRVTEAGAMNFFVALKGEDGGIDVVTPPLDGTILPGVTRASVIDLLKSHSAASPLPGVPGDLRIRVVERVVTVPELVQAASEGRLVESFAVGTAVVVACIARIGYEDADIIMPPRKDGKAGLGVVGDALYKKITAIQHGEEEYSGWSVPCV